MWKLWGVELSAFPLTWHIAYTTACRYRTSRDIGETISNNDLDASHYYYNIKRISIRRRVSNTSRKERKSFQKNTKENEKYVRLVTI